MPALQIPLCPWWTEGPHGLRAPATLLSTAAPVHARGGAVDLHAGGLCRACIPPAAAEALLSGRTARGNMVTMWNISVSLVSAETGREGGERGTVLTELRHLQYLLYLRQKVSESSINYYLVIFILFQFYIYTCLSLRTLLLIFEMLNINMSNM